MRRKIIDITFFRSQLLSGGYNSRAKKVWREGAKSSRKEDVAIVPHLRALVPLPEDICLDLSTRFAQLATACNSISRESDALF